MTTPREQLQARIRAAFDKADRKRPGSAGSSRPGLKLWGRSEAFGTRVQALDDEIKLAELDGRRLSREAQERKDRIEAIRGNSFEVKRTRLIVEPQPWQNHYAEEDEDDDGPSHSHKRQRIPNATAHDEDHLAAMFAPPTQTLENAAPRARKAHPAAAAAKETDPRFIDSDSDSGSEDAKITFGARRIGGASEQRHGTEDAILKLRSAAGGGGGEQWWLERERQYRSDSEVEDVEEGIPTGRPKERRTSAIAQAMSRKGLGPSELFKVLRVGDHVAVQWFLDQRWYRAKILSSTHTGFPNAMYKVEYVDIEGDNVDEGIPAASIRLRSDAAIEVHRPQPSTTPAATQGNSPAAQTKAATKPVSVSKHPLRPTTTTRPTRDSLLDTSLLDLPAKGSKGSKTMRQGTSRTATAQGEKPQSTATSAQNDWRSRIAQRWSKAKP